MSVDPKLQSSWDSVLEKVKRYYPDADFEILKKAFEFARTYHGSQKRSSGEAYIFHPVAVADILAELQLDVYSIATGLLHDTVEDCDTNVGEVEIQFGKEIALLVDGVTKLSKVKFKSSHEKQAENFRKMLLAMAQDLRVILVKLADRTHLSLIHI